MLALTDLLCTRLGLPAGSTTTALLDHMRGDGRELFGSLLASEDSKVAADGVLQQNQTYRLRVAAQAGLAQVKYCTVSFPNHSPVLVGLIPTDPAPILPTDLEALLFWALIHPSLEWQIRLSQGAAGDALDWPAIAGGMAIIAEPLDLPHAAQETIAGIFGLEHLNISSSSRSPPLIADATGLIIDAAADGFTATQARLLFETTSTTHPKWRCLSLYRLLENAYLTNIKSVLMLEFDLDAAKAIDNAKKKVGSEVNQLISLTENSDLKAEFVAFNTVFDLILASNNRYLTRLDKGAESDELYGSKDAYKKAILRFYKIRCSIAHAGTSSVIYEQFQDSNEAIFQLLPSIETIALKSLKIRAAV